MVPRAGLPAVLRPGALVRRLWPRCAPALAAFAACMANSIVVVLVTGKHTIDIDGDPTRTEWFVLGLLILVLPVATTVGWQVSRIRSVPNRTLVSSVSIGVAVAAGILGGPSPRIVTNLVLEGIVIAAALALTACGVGSILGWGLRTAIENVASVGALFVRALPVVLLTVLVFFNTYVWSMASTISSPRLWLALLFLAVIATAFITSATVDRVRPMLGGDRDRRRRRDGRHAVRVDAPPPRPPRCRGRNAPTWCSCRPPHRCYRSGWWPSSPGSSSWCSGLILLSPELLAQWSRNGSTTARSWG